MERKLTGENIAEWAREALAGFDPDLGLRDAVKATTAPAEAHEAVLDVASISVQWEHYYARKAVGAES